MASKTSKMLSEEHENILKVVGALDKECDELTNGQEADENFILNVVDFIKNYADKFHHAKEEDILFKEFCKIAEKGAVHCNPVDQMLYEHDEGRKFVKGIREGVKEKNKEKIIGNARGYIELLKEHIFKEDNILYPMADDVLDDGTQEQMLEKFREIGEERVEDKEKYLGFVEGLR
jgi:hemerythrin-like domain-containing protein|tara:strand:- start:80 stop:607 length:528 start_codon:yes stop_codon:yes gene_type:complete